MPMEMETLQVGSIGTNCYLVSDGEKAAIIDPGEEAQRIVKTLKQKGWTPEAVLLTHSHYDHTGAVTKLQKRFPDMPVYRNDADAYNDDPRMVQIYPPLNNTTPCGEGDTITVGELSFQVIATPGHTKGGLCFICEDALFCGDTLFAGSCGRTDLPGGNLGQMLSSLRRLAALEGNLTVYPGHMKASTLDREREYNPYIRKALGEVD